MNKYIKLDDALKEFRYNTDYYGRLSDLPTIEVSEDCISKHDIWKIIEDNAYWVRYNENSTEKGMTLTGINQALNECPCVVPSRAEGEWIDDPKNNAIKYCSNCELAYTKDFLLGMLPYDNPNPQMVEPPYCPNCGAKMK